jgi:hypothetical protein
MGRKMNATKMERAEYFLREVSKMMDEPKWERFAESSIVPFYRSGWLGVWDSIVAAIRRKDRYSVATPVVFSVWIKSRDPAKVTIEITGQSAEPSTAEELREFAPRYFPKDHADQ